MDIEAKWLNDTMVAKYGSCPEACFLCEEACAKARNGKSNILSLHIPELDFNGVVKCNQCGEPKCAEVCPTGAITKSELDGVVRITSQKCVGCGLCTLSCPYAGVFFDHELGKAHKCDTCDGEPECVAACPEGILSFACGNKVAKYLGEQILVKGTMNCAGCGIDLSVRVASRVFGKDTVYCSGPGCSIGNLMAMTDGCAASAPVAFAYMTNAPGIVTGIKRYYQHIGKDINCVIFAGDGMTSDVGFQPLSGAAERGENIIYICMDNEAYMNTGIQRSGTSPYLGWTTTTPVGNVIQGKQREAKNMPLLMLFHKIPYVATACVSYLADYVKKLEKAKSIKDGMAYIHVYAACPTGWKAPPDRSIDMGKMAVETDYFPLWEADNGKPGFTYRPKSILPISEFTKMSGRFRHLDEAQLALFGGKVKSRFNLLTSLIEANKTG